MEELRNRFKSAIATLKKSRAAGGRTGVFALFGRYYVYQMPWYVFIGAPGSGKTTALVNSGLRFPLADRFGVEAVRGVGRVPVSLETAVGNMDVIDALFRSATLRAWVTVGRKGS